MSEDSIPPSKSSLSRSVHSSAAGAQSSDVPTVPTLALVPWKPVFDGFGRVLLAGLGQAAEEGSQSQAAGLAQASAYALIDISCIVLTVIDMPY